MDNQPEAGSDHATHIDHSVGNALLSIRNVEGSPLVLRELAAALQRFVSCYDSSFCAVAHRFLEEEKCKDVYGKLVIGQVSVLWRVFGIRGEFGCLMPMDLRRLEAVSVPTTSFDSMECSHRLDQLAVR